jgi:hypothetical protein
MDATNPKKRKTEIMSFEGSMRMGKPEKKKPRRDNKNNSTNLNTIITNDTKKIGKQLTHSSAYPTVTHEHEDTPRAANNPGAKRPKTSLKTPTKSSQPQYYEEDGLRVPLFNKNGTKRTLRSLETLKNKNSIEKLFDTVEEYAGKDQRDRLEKEFGKNRKDPIAKWILEAEQKALGESRRKQSATPAPSLTNLEEDEDDDEEDEPIVKPSKKPAVAPGPKAKLITSMKPNPMRPNPAASSMRAGERMKVRMSGDDPSTNGAGTTPAQAQPASTQKHTEKPEHQIASKGPVSSASQTGQRPNGVGRSHQAQKTTRNNAPIVHAERSQESQSHASRSQQSQKHETPTNRNKVLPTAANAKPTTNGSPSKHNGKTATVERSTKGPSQQHSQPKATSQNIHTSQKQDTGMKRKLGEEETNNSPSGKRHAPERKEGEEPKTWASLAALAKRKGVADDPVIKAALSMGNTVFGKLAEANANSSNPRVSHVPIEEDPAIAELMEQKARKEAETRKLAEKNYARREAYGSFATILADTMANAGMTFDSVAPDSPKSKEPIDPRDYVKTLLENPVNMPRRRPGEPNPLIESLGLGKDDYKEATKVVELLEKKEAVIFTRINDTEVAQTTIPLPVGRTEEQAAPYLKKGQHGYDSVRSRWHFAGDPDLVTGVGHQIDPYDAEAAKTGPEALAAFNKKYPGQYTGHLWPCGCHIEYENEGEVSEEE